MAGPFRCGAIGPDGKPAINPTLKAARQRADMLHALSLQQKSNTSAGKFIRAGAIKDYIMRSPIVGYLGVLILAKPPAVDANRARNNRFV